MKKRPQLQVKKLHPEAIIPKQGSKYAAGLDIYSIEQKYIPSRASCVFKTGIAIAIPHGNYGRIAPRSGLAAKWMIDVGAGVIDEDYRGEGSFSFKNVQIFILFYKKVKVVLFNHGVDGFTVKKGDRIAQLIITKITYTDILEVEELSQTVRGQNGFGSTGIGQNHKDDDENEEESLQDYDPFYNDKVFFLYKFKQKEKQQKYKGILQRMAAFPQELTENDYIDFCVFGLEIMKSMDVISEEYFLKYSKMAQQDFSIAKDIYVALHAYQDTESKFDLNDRLKHILEQEKHFIDD